MLQTALLSTKIYTLFKVATITIQVKRVTTSVALVIDDLLETVKQIKCKVAVKRNH